MTQLKFSTNNRTAFAAARLSTQDEMLLEAPANIPASAWLSNRSASPIELAAPAGLLIDLPETIATTAAQRSTDFPVETNSAQLNGSAGIPGRIVSATDGSDMRIAAQRAWLLALDRIRPQLSAQTMRTWFEPLEAMMLEGSEITLRAPSSFFCEWIGEHYQDTLEQSLRDVLGPSARFRFDTISEVESVNTKLEAAAAPNIPVPIAPAFTPAKPVESFGVRQNPQPFAQLPHPIPVAPTPANSKQPAFDSLLNPRYTFDTFIRGESNKLAYGAAMAVANNPGGTRYNPLVIYGNVGLGKTHLIQAIGHAAMQKFPSAKVLYTSSERFTVEFVDAIQNDRINEFQALYRSIDVLIIDDVQFFAGKEKTQDIFFHTFNALRELGKQIILTCDRPPKELKDIDDRLLNRLQWGLTTDIGAPDLETRIAILRHKAIADGIELPGEVIEFVAANVTSNIRELEGCLISLLAMSSLEGREPTLDLARDVLRKIARRATPIISIDAIQRTVARKLGIEEELLRHKTRKQEVVLARQIAMYLCKEMTNHSLKSIGYHFGGRDHSTVIHAIQTIQDDMKLEPLLVKRIDELRKAIEMMQ